MVLISSIAFTDGGLKIDLTVEITMHFVYGVLAFVGVGSFWKPCRKRTSHVRAPIDGLDDKLAVDKVFAAPIGTRYHRLHTCAGKNAVALTPCDTCCKKVLFCSWHPWKKWRACVTCSRMSLTKPYFLQEIIVLLRVSLAKLLSLGFVFKDVLSKTILFVRKYRFC